MKTYNSNTIIQFIFMLITNNNSRTLHPVCLIRNFKITPNITINKPPTDRIILSSVTSVLVIEKDKSRVWPNFWVLAARQWQNFLLPELKAIHSISCTINT